MAEIFKRKPDDELPATTGEALVKRTRSDRLTHSDGALVQRTRRTSTMQAPIMLLTGHDREVLSCRYNPSGALIATGGLDKTILLWNTSGKMANFAVLKGHSNAILDMRWSADGESLYSVSADKSVCIWNPNLGTRIRRYREHSNIVNCCDATRRAGATQMICSGSDDGFIKVWDPREKKSVMTLTHGFQVTSVAFNADGSHLYAGSIDNGIHLWDLRSCDTIHVLRGHTDTVTGLSLSSDGQLLASNSMDSTLRLWNTNDHQSVRIMKGAPHSSVEPHLIRCAFSSDGKRIAAGSADRTVVVWDVATSNIQYKLPGHKGCVNDVDFHPFEPILMSGSSDKHIYLSELD